MKSTHDSPHVWKNEPLRLLLSIRALLGLWLNAFRIDSHLKGLIEAGARHIVQVPKKNSNVLVCQYSLFRIARKKIHTEWKLPPFHAPGIHTKLSKSHLAWNEKDYNSESRHDGLCGRGRRLDWFGGVEICHVERIVRRGNATSISRMSWTVTRRVYFDVFRTQLKRYHAISCKTLFQSIDVCHFCMWKEHLYIRCTIPPQIILTR